MNAQAQVQLVRLQGDARERGRRHGAARAQALQGFAADGIARLEPLLRRPVSVAELRPAIDACRAWIVAATPELAAEIDGLAAGSGLDEDTAYLLQLRREVIGYERVPTMGDCTTYARAGSDGPVLAQTVDLNGDLDDQICVLDVEPAAGRRTLVLSFGGLLGYLGLNDRGLAIGINLVLGGAWRPGLPPYLAIRHLLDVASGVDEAIELLRGLRLSSSRSLTLCDQFGTATVEILGDELRVVKSAQSTHTNHYLHPDLAAGDELNVFAGNFSRQRLQACRAALRTLPADADVEDHFAVLSRPPICVRGDGDIRRERTVAAVVLRPGQCTFHLRPGDPSTAVTQAFGLDRRKEARHV
jgi:isopenicillin-N N-acyltransferase-like protein